MRRGTFVLNLVMAGLVVAGSAGFGYAANLKVSGFADVTWWFGNDQPTIDAATGNTLEQKFRTQAEVDFEKQEGDVTFRLDLDFSGNSCDQSVNGIFCAGSAITTIIEQANFNWAKAGAPMGLNLTAGIFNSPIGLESQDSPDRQFVTYGQLYGMVPSNLTGLQLAVSQGDLSASIIYANEWRTAGLGAVEENSVGFTLSFNPQPLFGVSIGYLTSDNGATPATAQDEDILDIIVSGVSPLGSGAELNYALEFITDENNTGLGLTVGATHGKHALTLRYDSVDCDAGSVFCGLGATAPSIKPTSLTLSASCELSSVLTGKLEYVTYDADSAALIPPDADLLLVQFVATFN